MVDYALKFSPVIYFSRYVELTAMLLLISYYNNKYNMIWKNTQKIRAKQFMKNMFNIKAKIIYVIKLKMKKSHCIRGFSIGNLFEKKTQLPNIVFLF